MIKDDQALVAYIEGKGLVIISGCGHAGIINTINYAKKLEETKRFMQFLEAFTCQVRYMRMRSGRQ